MRKIITLLYAIVGKTAFLKFGAFVACLLFSVGTKAQGSLTAIANTSGAPAEMKHNELKAVLMGETQRWKNGKRVLIALMKTNTALGKTTSEKVYDMTGDELNKYWLSLVFQGKAQAPVFFTSVSELQNYVAQNPGAIGVIDKAAPASEVRTIMVDGKPAF